MCLPIYATVSNRDTVSTSVKNKIHFSELAAEIENIKLRGGSFDENFYLSKRIENLTFDEKEKLLELALINYSNLLKSDPNALLSPKRAIDHLISLIFSPLMLFKSYKPNIAYLLYLATFQDVKGFYPPALIIKSIKQIAKTISGLTISPETKITIWGSFINGRGHLESDVDINFYGADEGLIKTNSLDDLFAVFGFNKIPISILKSSVSNFESDIQWQLITQPLVVVIQNDEVHFYIRGESIGSPPKIFKVKTWEL